MKLTPKKSQDEALKKKDGKQMTFSMIQKRLMQVAEDVDCFIKSDSFLNFSQHKFEALELHSVSEMLLRANQRAPRIFKKRELKQQSKRVEKAKKS